MPGHSRNLLLFLVLSGAAVLTWLVSREPDAPAATATNRPQPPQGYYLVDARLLDINDDGRIHSTIQARRLEQRPGDEDFVLSGIRVEYDSEPGSRWVMDAADGFMPRDRSYFDLREVQIRLTRGPGAGGNSATFETSELHLDANEMVASTEQSVTFRDGDSERVARGMTLDLDEGTYTLGPNVTTIRTQP